MDGFDQLPDSLILLIFNSVSDVKILIRCRSVCKRFNSLVPQTESLLLKIDRVISSESDSDSLFLTLLKSVLHHIFPKPTLGQLPNRTHTYPAQILSRFQRIRQLYVELPAGDLQLEKGTVVKWRAEFGETLNTCVIFGFRLGNSNNGNNNEGEFAGGLKRRVMWTISALIAASVRHFLLREVVREHNEIEELVLTDREGEGVVVVEKQGLKEWREARKSHVEDEEEVVEEEERGRTVVPSVRMRMRHEPRLGATLVVVRAVRDGAQVVGREADVEDADLAMKAFGRGVYGDVVLQLLKVRSYLLEMNSF